MTFIVATNVVASRPPERRPAETPHARANNWQTVQRIKHPGYKMEFLFIFHI